MLASRRPLRSFQIAPVFFFSRAVVFARHAQGFFEQLMLGKVHPGAVTPPVAAPATASRAVLPRRAACRRESLPRSAPSGSVLGGHTRRSGDDGDLDNGATGGSLVESVVASVEAEGAGGHQHRVPGADRPVACCRAVRADGAARQD